MRDDFNTACAGNYLRRPESHSKKKNKNKKRKEKPKTIYAQEKNTNQVCIVLHINCKTCELYIYKKK